MERSYINPLSGLISSLFKYTWVCNGEDFMFFFRFCFWCSVPWKVRSICKKIWNLWTNVLYFQSPFRLLTESFFNFINFPLLSHKHQVILYHKKTFMMDLTLFSVVEFQSNPLTFLSVNFFSFRQFVRFLPEILTDFFILTSNLFMLQLKYHHHHQPLGLELLLFHLSCMHKKFQN